MSLLTVDSVTHSYPTSPHPVLHDISLEINDDDIVAVVGESGCGKSTLGRLMVGLDSPSAGQILYRGQDPGRFHGARRRDWRRHVQMIHQDPYGSLNPGLTIGATLAPGLLKHGLATRSTVGRTMMDLLNEVGLDPDREFLRRYPHQLSGGQRQRVSIARTIALQPELIVADEVTSMLDVSMRVSILDLLRSFREGRTMAYVFISHDFGVVRYFARGGRIIVMFFGHVVEIGPSEKLINEPRHPYTRTLLEAIPVPDPQVARARGTGSARSGLVERPALHGCPFAHRCPLVVEECRHQRPTLVPDESGHAAACIRSDDVPGLQEPWAV